MAKQKATAKIGDVVQVTAFDSDVQLVQTDGSLIQGFLGGLVPFFRRATELETKAKELLTAAKTLKPATNGQEDAHLQNFVKTATAAKKTADEHWGICQTIHRLHRTLTAKRGLTTQALDDAGNIAQRLHNTYTENERRRAQEEARREEERLRREAQERRDAEVKRIEAEATRLEEESADLSERETVFVTRYIETNGNAYQAAYDAGYAQPRSQAEKLLSRDKILKAIEARRVVSNIRAQAVAINERPLEVETFTPIADIVKVGTDRSTHSADLVDKAAFIAALLDPSQRATLGIPIDVIDINLAALNKHAQSQRELINRWPGVRYKKTTRTI